GLTQSIFVSVPDITIRLDMSNIAEGEWCAHSETVPRSSISASTTLQIVCLTVQFSFGGIARSLSHSNQLAGGCSVTNADDGMVKTTTQSPVKLGSVGIWTRQFEDHPAAKVQK